MSRAVRAPAFQGATFGGILGSGRYQWWNDLGNQAIIEGGRLRIRNPEAAAALLDLAITRFRSRQRIIFFCSCEFPWDAEKGPCHRIEVSRLLVAAARKQQVHLTIEEWPGGDPEELEVVVSKSDLRRLVAGGRAIPLPDDDVARHGAVPWRSIAAVTTDDGDSIFRPTGPARYGKSGWHLPIPWRMTNSRPSRVELHRWMATLRSEPGYHPMSV